MNYNEPNRRKLNLWIPKELFEDLEEWADISHDGNMSMAVREALYFFSEDKKAVEYKKEKVTAILKGYELQIKHKEEQEEFKKREEKRKRELELKIEIEKKQELERKESEEELKKYYQAIYNKLVELPKEQITAKLDEEINILDLDDSKKKRIGEKLIEFLCKVKGLNESDFEKNESNVSKCIT